jgi:GNAT superfamily N-acetyltransferase
MYGGHLTTVFTRLATVEDVATVASLFDAYRQFYEQEADLPVATAFIRDRIQKNESVIIVAENKDRHIIGFCQLYPTFCSVATAPIYALYDLFVRPEARKAGTGRALLLAAEEHAARNGFARMDLATAKTNLPAQSLYESLGWVRDEVFYAYHKPVSYHLRPAQPTDAEAITACVDAAYRPYIERVGRKLGPMLEDYSKVICERQVTVAEVNGTIAAVLVLAVTSEGFLLDNVAVQPQHRGIGKALLKYAESEARRQGFGSIYLYTHEKMTENQTLYLKIGYVEYDRRLENGFPRVYMRKNLE